MRRILYPAPLSFDLMGYGADALIEEILMRSGLMMADFDANIHAYGIVDSSDPRLAIAGGTKPFSVSVDATLTTTINIQAGIAVFKSGEIIVINEPILQIALADSTPNTRNIVYLRFSEVETNPLLTRHNVLVNSTVEYLASNEEYIQVLVKDDYDALSTEEKDLTIPLAIVTTQLVSASGGGTVLRVAVDMTRNTFEDNRPWFSVVDAEHRSHLGTGAVTSVNVHGLSINDLSAAGDLTFLQVALDHGMIVSKDRGIAGVAGSLCTEDIASASVLTDGTGSVTGILNARYFKLSRVPRLVHRVEMPLYATGSITNGAGGTIGEDESFTLNDGENPAVTFKFDTNSSVVETNTTRRIAYTGVEVSSELRDKIVTAINSAPLLNITASPNVLANITDLINDNPGADGNQTITDTVTDASFIVSGMTGGVLHEMAHFWVPGSNVVALLPNDEYVVKGPAALKVTCSVVDAGEPILATVNPTFKVKTATTSEVVVSGGLFIDNITGTELSFENEGPIPSKYTAYIDDTGALQKFPQTVFCYKKLSDIGFALQSFESSPLGNSRLKVFLAHATAGATLNVQAQITGSDIDGFTVTETVTFGSSWAENVAPTCSENTNQYVITDTIWSAIDNVIVSVRENDGVDTAILIQALVDPVSVPLLGDVLPVAEIVWDGQQVCSVRDIRPVNTSLSLPNYLPISAAGPMTAAFTASVIAGELFQYWAEDFEKPRLVTTEVTDTTSGSGLIPTEIVMTKLAKGLGRNDVYVSRPIPIKPYTGSPMNLRFIPIQVGAEFTLKVRYYTAGGTNAWSSWSTLASPYDVSVASADVIKWQMVVTGPVEGMFVVMTTPTGLVDGTRFISNKGAWIDGVFI